MTMDGEGDSRFDVASLLVVDDDRIGGRKIAMAVAALGHHADLVDTGVEALHRLRTEPPDIVLLDLMMPGMDGFAVLEAIRFDAELRDIPVIVISGLDEEVESVARAIRLGAVDFLPKTFEPAIFKARINATLGRKRRRDRELAYIRDIEKMTGAAQVVEKGEFAPGDLDLSSVALREDALGRLARVMGNLADNIYAHERRLDLRARTLRGALLVIVAGSLFGITPALGRLAHGASIPPLGLLFWACVTAALACLTYSVIRCGLPALRMRDLGFLGLWAIVLGCTYNLLTLVIAAHVEATMIALVGSTRGFMVFLLAALIGLERPKRRRFFGLGVGFAAVLVVLMVQGGAVGEDDALWMVAALVLPFCLAIHTLLMTRRPRHLDPAAAVGIMMAISAVLIAPFAIGSDSFFLPSPDFGQRELILLVLGISTAIALVLALELVATAGPVFASQMAYSQTLAGIVWGMIILGETLVPLAWIACAIVLLGFWLVEPKRADGDLRISIGLPGRPRRRAREKIVDGAGSPKRQDSA